MIAKEQREWGSRVSWRLRASDRCKGANELPGEAARHACRPIRRSIDRHDGARSVSSLLPSQRVGASRVGVGQTKSDGARRQVAASALRGERARGATRQIGAGAYSAAVEIARPSRARCDLGRHGEGDRAVVERRLEGGTRRCPHRSRFSRCDASFGRITRRLTIDGRKL